MLNYDEISLMAFSSGDVVESWKQHVIEEQRLMEQILDVTEHVNQAHKDSYARNAHTNEYARYSVDRYEQTATVDRYSESIDVYSNVPAADKYSEVAHKNQYMKNGHTDRYTQHGLIDRYSKQAHADTHSNVPHANTYTKVAEQNVYDNTPHRNRYYRIAYRDVYTNRSGYTYYTAGYYAYGQYSRERARDRYTRNNPNYRETRVGRYYRTRNGPGNHGNGGAYNAYNAYFRGPHTNRYSRSAHTNSYTRGNSYSAYYYRYAYRQSYDNVAHRNSYSQAARRDNYYQVPGRNIYAEAALENRYSKVAASDRYDRVGVADKYEQINARDLYGEVVARNEYTKTAKQDVYSRENHTNTYSEVAASDRYNEVAETNRGFNHENYIPSAPELYNIDGRVISDELEIRMISYDKNSDGYGSQDNDSIDIYYTVKIRKLQELDGTGSAGEWQVVQNGKMTEDFNVDLNGYSDGIYEISSQAFNKPRTMNGVTKEYISEENIYTFTVDNDESCDITIVNDNEFREYVYGLETYSNRIEVIKKYATSTLYQNSDEQAGLFLEIDLKDTNIESYHKVKAGLVKNNAVIARGYDVIFEETEPGIQKSGDKTGVVFIPIDDMTDMESYEKVQITLDVTEYKDPQFKNQRGTSERVLGVNEVGTILLIDVDSKNPQITISSPSSGTVMAQVINMYFTDVQYSDGGTPPKWQEKDLKETYYQIVKSGTAPRDNGWEKIKVNDDGAASIKLAQTGTWDVYAKAVDRAGNETITSKKGYKIDNPGATLDVPAQVYRNSVFDVIGNVYDTENARQVKFYIQDHGDYQIDTSAIRADDGSLEYSVELLADKEIPLGNHIVWMEVTYFDWSVKKLSKPIEVIAVPPVETIPGPRFIDDENLDTIPDDSKWNTDPKYRQILQRSLNNRNPAEFIIKKN